MSIYERDPLTATAAAALGEVTPVTSQSGCGIWVWTGERVDGWTGGRVGVGTQIIYASTP